MPEQETAANVRTGETVTREVATADEAYVAALLRERDGYARMEREDRVKAVDAELERLGYVRDEKVADADEDEDEDTGGQDGDGSPPAAPVEPVVEPQETAAESKPRRTARSKS